jgi:two-component system, chemotaxis family, chemotaxis protein CheY
MKNILIVDDNNDILDALAGSLCRCLKDCSIITASNGTKGEAIMKDTPIDLILTELSMPVMNGYKFIEQVKKNHPFVPVCVMTGDCSPPVIKRLELMGVGRWIEKPFHFDKLATMISEELSPISPASPQREPAQA